MRFVQLLKIVLLVVLLADFSAPVSMSFNRPNEFSSQSSKPAALPSRSPLRAFRDDAELLRYLRTAASSPRTQPQIRAERAARALTTAEEAIVQIASFFFSEGKYYLHKTGSGIVVHSNGTVLTNVHVIHNVAQGCTITDVASPRADLLVILIQDPEKPTEPPTPQFAVDLRGLTGEALAHALPAEDLSLDLAVLRINKRVAGAKNLNELIQAVKANALVLADLREPLDLEALALWDTAAIEVGQDLQLGGYPDVSPRLTFTEGPVLEKRADGTMVLNRAFATYGFSGGALIEKRSGFVVGILCGGQSIETPAGTLILAVGRALDVRVQQLFRKVPEVKRRPVPRFAVTPGFPKPGETVTLDASDSFDPDGTIAKYEWDFDGDSIPDALGVKVQRAFQDDSHVTLIVTDGDGLKAQRTQRVILDRHEQLRQTGQQCKPIQIGDRTFDSIQAAIEAAQPGDTITVGPGTCQESLTIDKSVTLQGAGRDKTTLLGDGHAPVIKIEVPTGKPQIVVTMEGFTIRNGLHAVQAWGNVKVTVRESDLGASTQQGVDVAFGADITLTGNRISENDEEGVVLEGGKAELRGNTIANNKDKGVVIKNLRTHSNFIQADATLDENKIEMNGGFGLFVTQQAKAQIQGGQISRNQSTGLEADEQVDLKIVATWILENNDDGVHLFDAAVEFNENTAISNNKNGGLRIGGSARVSLANSQIFNNWNGLFVQDSAQVSLTNSTVSCNSWIGLWVLNSATVSLTRSTISNNEDDGISLWDSTQASITNSLISGNNGWAGSSGMAGIKLRGSAQAIISNSQVLDNWTGIVVLGPAQAIISNSQVSDNLDGIELWGSARVILSNSRVSNNGITGISLWNSAQATITGTTISDNKYDGILIWDSAQANIKNNSIQGNSRCGICSSSDKPVQGGRNLMNENGVDLCGNLFKELRVPLVPETDQKELTFPGPYDSLQKTIDALAPGGTVLVGSGEHQGGLTIWKPLSLNRAGQEQTKIKGAVSLISEAQGVQLRGLAIIGSTSFGIMLGGSAQATITNSLVSGSSWHGIVLWGIAQATLSNSVVSGNTYNGIFLWDSTHTEIRDSIIEGNGKEIGDCTWTYWPCNGITVWHKSQVKLIGSKVRGNADWGIGTILKQCGYERDDFTGQVIFEDMKLEDISGNNTTGNQNGMGNPGNHPWNRPDVPDGQVCLP